MILYFLNLLDHVSTLIALECGAVELNPLLNTIIDFYPPLLHFVKIFLAFFLCLWLEHNAMFNPPARERLAIITAIYSFVVINNIAVICLMMI